MGVFHFIFKPVLAYLFPLSVFTDVISVLFFVTDVLPVLFFVTDVISVLFFVTDVVHLRKAKKLVSISCPWGGCYRAVILDFLPQNFTFTNCDIYHVKVLTNTY